MNNDDREEGALDALRQRLGIAPVPDAKREAGTTPNTLAERIKTHESSAQRRAEHLRQIAEGGADYGGKESFKRAMRRCGR